ncbi:MAG: SDR family oxidoreductase [Pseudomonadota bacterium]
MTTLDQHTALITGASSGIGAAFARLFAADGIDLVLVASNAERLESYADEIRGHHPIRVATLPADLSAPGAPREIADFLDRKHLRVDYLVNNAGVGLLGNFCNNGLEKELAMMRLNMDALVGLTKLTLPGMLKRKHGRILNVCSLAARQPGGPGAAVYFATKAFVFSFSNGLGAELKGSGVGVTALCPGPTDTPFRLRSGFDKTITFNRFMTRSPEQVAKSGYRAMQRGDAVCYPGFMPKVFALASAVLPRKPALTLNRLFLRPRPSCGGTSSTEQR